MKAQNKNPDPCTSYDYDQAGNLTEITYPGSIGAVNIKPDWQGWIKSLDAGGPDIVTYEYMGSKVAQRRYPTAGVTYQPTYDTLGRMTSANSGESYAKFDYTYYTNTDNIEDQTYDHRDGDPDVTFSYDALDRLTGVSYGIDSTTESFTYDDLGNRDSVTLRDTSTDDYNINVLTNRYDDIDQTDLEYDQAGNLTLDQNGYGYEYDYENRITKVTKNSGTTTVAEFAYNALGRRIRKIAGGVTTLYYHNNNWQVLAETDGSGDTQRWYIYGNYIDEPLRMTDTASGNSYYYVHDHLYSPVALVDEDGEVVERYEYDAYGNCHVLDPDFSADADGLPDYGNPYLFTGRRVDMLDSGGLKLQGNRERYYNQPTGRWYTHDPLGIVPNAQAPNRFDPERQHADGGNLYEYVGSNPSLNKDALGLMTVSAGENGINALFPFPPPQVVDTSCVISRCVMYLGAWVNEEINDFDSITTTIVDSISQVVLDESIRMLKEYRRTCFCWKKVCCLPYGGRRHKTDVLWERTHEEPRASGDDSLSGLFIAIHGPKKREKWRREWSNERCIKDCKASCPDRRTCLVASY